MGVTRVCVAVVIALIAAGLALTAATAGNLDRAPTTAPTVRSVSAGLYHACAILRGGSVKCWGNNQYGQLGLGDTDLRGDQSGEMGADLPAIDLGTGRTATTVSAGADHTCALLNDATIKCWGRNIYGSLGLGDSVTRGDQPDEMGDALPAIALGTGRTAVALSVGIYQSCAILDNGVVKCWGDNSHGLLGLGDTEHRGDHPGEMGDALPAVDLGTGRTARAISAEGGFTCAALDNGAVKCWGAGEHGRLGLGDVWNRGDQPNEMGDNLPALDLGVGRFATDVGHNCARFDDGAVKCWGDNGSGQLGQGDTTRRGDQPDELGDGLAPVDLGTGRTATSLASGGYGRPCAILDDGSTKCWGPNAHGALGLGDTLNRGDDPNEMGDHLPAVDLGAGRHATEVHSGGDYHCARLDDTTVKCWGRNDFGQLGLGDTADRGDAPGEMGDNLPPVDLGDPTAPELAVVLQADRDWAFTGDDIDFGLTITNTGDVHLTNTTVSVPGAVGCDADLGTFSVGAQEILACTHTATQADVGTYSTTATVTSDQTGPVASNQVDVTVHHDRQPDLSAKRGGGPWRGGGVQGTDPTDPDQTVTAGRKRGGVVVFYARIQNTGDHSARYQIRRLGAGPGLTVRYLQGRGSTDLTQAITDRTHRTSLLAPGQSTTIRVEVTVKVSALRRQSHDITLRSRSEADRTQTDTVRATVFVN